MPLASPLRAGYAGSGNVRHKHGTEGLVGEVATQPLIRRPLTPPSPNYPLDSP